MLFHHLKKSKINFLFETMKFFKPVTLDCLQWRTSRSQVFIWKSDELKIRNVSIDFLEELTSPLNYTGTVYVTQ